MKLRATIAAISTAAALGLTGAVLLPAAASAGTVTHTLTFTSVQKSQVKFSATSSGSADLDVNKALKAIGFDMLNFTVNPATGKAAGGVTLDTNGGFLYGTLKFTQKPSHSRHCDRRNRQVQGRHRNDHRPEPEQERYADRGHHHLPQLMKTAGASGPVCK